MPIYMDLHKVDGVTPEALAEAHVQDLKYQDEFQCKAMTYWLDQHKGCAFCLIEGPSAEAVKGMHAKAHGLLPSEIIEVNTELVNSFLGRVQDPEDAEYKKSNEQSLKVFNDPAFRVISIIQCRNDVLLRYELGEAEASALLALYVNTVKKEVSEHSGSLVETEGDDFVVSFRSVSDANRCAVAVSEALKDISARIDLKISVHAGFPVDKSSSLFGETIRLSSFLCKISNSTIINSYTVKELSNNSPLTQNRGEIKVVSPSEEEFMKELVKALYSNWQNADFDLTDFCNQLSVSKSQLYRKCVNFTGKSPNILLREFRLRQSLQLLKRSARNISQTAFDSGFNNPSYFTKCFHKQFGVNPLQFVSEMSN